MNELLDKSLAQIVTDNYKTAQVFEKYGLDFCCKGKRTLQHACEEKGITVNNVLTELSLQGSGGEEKMVFPDLTATELVNHITSVHHQYIRENTPIITAYLLKVVEKHGDRYPFMEEVLARFLTMAADLNEHMRQEEQVVFPFILGNSELHSNDVLQDIHRMEEEHDHAGFALQQIRRLTNDYQAPPNACTTFRLVINLLHDFEKDLHQHVHLENNLLFPMFLASNQLPSDN